MKTLAIIALAICPTAFAQQTMCHYVGQYLYCQTINQPAPVEPTQSFDPSVISGISDSTADEQRQITCIAAGRAAGMSDAQIVAVCIH
jgi:hypothetical protein